ncbi:MAG: hypothetical protein KDE26_22110, partial [Bacteroidetes bacterium]|nr:hypothetical protein [Bacteroidota bacterium]
PSEMKISLFFRVSGCDSCLQSNLVQKILPDPEGGYWVATSQGLYHWNPEAPPPKGSFRGFFSNSGKDGYLASDDIRDIVLDKQGTLWIATQKGLNSLKEGVIKSYHFQKKGNRAFHALIPMNEEELLIATHSGTALFNKVEKRFSHFWGQEITGTWQKGAKINSKEALIVGRNSWRKINLDSLKKTMEAPVPYLIGFQVNGKTQRSHSQALMGYNDYLTVWLSALHLQNAETFSIQYRWDEDAQLWQQAPQNGVLQLSGLRQGLHTLKVRVEDGNGIVSGETQLLQVKVTPPFWLSWPFILGVFLVLLGAVLGVQRYRFGQQQKQYAIRLGIAGDLHDEVGSALGSILIGSELAGKLLDEGKSKMIIENIRAIASQTMQNMSDIIWAIQPQHDSGEKLTVKMQQVGKELLIQQGILINCHFDAAIESLSFSMQARKNLMLIYKEVLHNISKHAEATRAEVEMHIQHRYLVMKITDNGKGFVIGNHTGNGLESMQRRAKNLSGNLAIESNLGQGTTVSLEVLLVNIKS